MDINQSTDGDALTGSQRKMDISPARWCASAIVFEELNVFGTATGNTILLLRGEEPPPPQYEFTGHPLRERPAVELRERAREYRRMARTATTAETQEALLRLAGKFDVLANEKDALG
jgi:hypothetical protein